MDQPNLFAAPTHDDIPPYRTRISRRARRLQMRVMPDGELELIVPHRCNRAHIPAFLHQFRDWIQERQAEATRRRQRHPELYETRPERLQLRTLQQCWQIRYVDDARRLSMDITKTVLNLPDDGTHTTQQRLQRWLNKQALKALTPAMNTLCAETGLCYENLQIRGQKTRWGSCSYRGQINLNRGLLFLPPELTHYILVHELCHTRYPNHSAPYWRLVERVEPDYRRLDAAMRQAGRYVPLWVYSG